ncbi:MAG TPA: hypothetical protein VKA95_13895 [Nitrososphaeraceae archaeon]|nr:hypothetical protein [Nitrososphaeraceae archaeon]
MQTRDKGKESEDEIRDLELENIAGNLLIAEYQVDKLRARLSDMVNGYRPGMRYNKASTHIFKHNDKWYKLSIRIDKTDANNAKVSGQTSSQDIPVRDEY